MVQNIQLILSRYLIYNSNSNEHSHIYILLSSLNVVQIYATNQFYVYYFLAEENKLKKRKLKQVQIFKKFYNLT